MPLNIRKTPVGTIAFPSVSNTAESCDTNIIVPDSKPDVREVIYAVARTLINEKKVQRDYITLSGVTDYELVYLAEGEGEIESLSTRVPFTHQLELSCGEGAYATVKCNGEPVVATVVNSRKINIRHTIEFETNAVLSVTSDVVSGADCGLPCRSVTAESTCLVAFCERDFQVGGTLSRRGGAPSEILATDCRIDSREIKFINGKPVAKGVVRATALYRDDGGNLCTATGDFPFTEPFGWEGEGDIREAEYTLTDGEFIIKRDGDCPEISVNLSYTLSAFVYEDCTVELVTDIYSPDCELEADREEIRFSRIAGAFEEYPVRDTITLAHGGDTADICNTTVTPIIEDIKSNPSGCEAVGKAVVRLCCVATGGGIHTVEKEIPFTCPVGITPAPDDRISVVAEAENISADISGGGADVRFTLCLQSHVATDTALSCICDVRETDAETDGEDAPSVVLYFPSAGEKLWDIAKSYRTTTDAIERANGRDFGETFAGGEVVMIPRRN